MYKLTAVKCFVKANMLKSESQTALQLAEPKVYGRADNILLTLTSQTYTQGCWGGPSHYVYLCVDIGGPLGTHLNPASLGTQKFNRFIQLPSITKFPYSPPGPNILISLTLLSVAPSLHRLF